MHNLVVDGSSLFGFIIGADRLFAVCAPATYKNLPTSYKYIMGYGSLCVLLAVIAASFFDKFNTQLIPVCIIRPATGIYMTQYGDYVMTIINATPTIFFLVSYLILHYRAKTATGSQLMQIKKKIRSKVMRVLTFLTVFQTATFTLSTCIFTYMTRLPYRGAYYAPYYRMLYFAKGIAIFACYYLYVDKLRIEFHKATSRRNLVAPAIHNAVEMAARRTAN